MRVLGSRLGAAVAAAVLLAGLPGSPPARAGAAPGACPAWDGDDPRPHCCFTNPRYVGICEVEPSEGETCASILKYLNNPQSQGKAYCNSTNVRGGWKPVPCQPEMKQG